MRKMNTPPQRITLSNEEQAILQDEQNDLMADVEVNGHDIDRLVATNDSLNDTIQVVNDTPEFGVVDRGLVDAVADAAVAGTDADPEQVVPTIDTGLAMEGFVSDALERLKKLWEKIKEYLLKAWESLKNYLTGEKRQLESVQKQAIEVEKFVEEHKSILMLEYTPENVKTVKALRLQYQRSDSAIPMGGRPSVALGYDKGVDERADKARADAEARAQAEEDRRNKPMQLQNQRNDRAMPMPGPSRIALGYDDGVDTRRQQAQDESDAAYQQRIADEAAAREASDSRNEEERRAGLEKALADMKSKLGNHQFKFHGDFSLISTATGVPKDFDRQVTNLSSYAQDVHKNIGKTLRDLCYAFEGALTKFHGSKSYEAIGPFTERFHKDLEILGRQIGEMKDNDGLLRAHTRGYMLGHFDVELTDEKKDHVGDIPRQLTSASKATLAVSHGSEKKTGEAPMLDVLMNPALANTVKRWTDFQLSHDGAALENQLKEYGEKFITQIDQLMKDQQAVSGASETDIKAHNVIQGLISVCRALDRMIIEYTVKYTVAVRLIMQNALRYQQQAAEERVRLYKEAVSAF